MLRLLRFACVAYWAALTLLLLVPDPLGLLGLRENPWPLASDRGIHFSLFLALAILAGMSRWAIRPGWFFGLLAAYAAGTELLQAFVPPRTVDALDLTENLLGLAIGTLIVWAVRWRFATTTGRGHARPPSARGG
jgi:hypothetical protein